jgi:uncharacterized protein YdeI (BOF family)
MMKRFILAFALAALTSLGAMADDMKVEPKVDTGDPKGGGDFSGTVTAVETIRDSFTVTNEDGIVKMFTISPDQKSKLTVGQRVTVSYTDQYTWPLPTKGVNIKE